MSRLNIVIPDELDQRLAKMSDEVNMPKSHLAIMSLYSLVARYEEQGTFIFVDLIDPETRKERAKRKAKES